MAKYFLPTQDLKTISTLDENVVFGAGISINGEKLTKGGHLPKLIVESSNGKQFILKEDKASEFMLGTLYSKLLGEHSCTMKFSLDSDTYKSASEIVPNSMTLKSFMEKHPEDIASIEGMEEVLAASFLMREWDFTNTNVLVQNINGRNIAVKIDHEQSGKFLFDSFLTAEQKRDELLTDFIKKFNDDLHGLKIDYTKFIKALKKYTQIFPEIVLETAQELEDLIEVTKNDPIGSIKSNADYVSSVIIPHIESFEQEIYGLNIQEKMWLYYILPQDSINLIVNHFSRAFTQAEKDEISGVKSSALTLSYAIANQIQINGENPLIKLASLDKVEQMLVLLELPDREFAKDSGYYLLWKELFDSKHKMFDYKPDFYSMLDINAPLLSEESFDRVIKSFASFKTDILSGRAKTESSTKYWDNFVKKMARISDDLGAICFEVFGLQEQGFSMEEFGINIANLHPKHEALKAAMMTKIQHYFEQDLETYKASIAVDAIRHEQFAVADELIKTPEDLSSVIQKDQFQRLYRQDAYKSAVSFVTKKAIALADKGNVFTLSDVNYILDLNPGDMKIVEFFLGKDVKIASSDDSSYALNLAILSNLRAGEYETAKAIIQLAKEKTDTLPDFKSVYSYINKYSLGENTNNGIVEFLTSQYSDEYASGSDINHNLELYLTVETISHDLLIFNRSYIKDARATLAYESLHAMLDGSDISEYEILLGKESYNDLVEMMSQ